MTTTKTIHIKDICLVGMFTAVTAILSPWAIPLPFTPVPISFGIVAVFIAGMILEPKQAFLSQLVFLLLGAVGLPVFSKFTGGLGIIIGPTGGYLFAYPFMAFCVSLLLHDFDKRAGTASLLLVNGYTAFTLIISLVVLYSLGTLWLSYLAQIPISKAAGMAVYPFIPFDLVKVFITTVAVLPIRNRVRKVY